jgi:kynurenine 3-monooxygenase
VPDFFDDRFPGVTKLISRESLVESFIRNPHLPLISIRCKPFHFRDAAVIIGDAAHAMVPFYGQGMNAGLEDVRILFDFLDTHTARPDVDAAGRKWGSSSISLALEDYTTFRVPDAHAINDLALDNYVEMRSSVLSPLYRMRKYAEELVSLYCPGLGWQTKYSRVSFGNERYSAVIAKDTEQGRVISRIAFFTVGSSVMGLLWLCSRRHINR